MHEFFFMIFWHFKMYFLGVGSICTWEPNWISHLFWLKSLTCTTWRQGIFSGRPAYVFTASDQLLEQPNFSLGSPIDSLQDARGEPTRRFPPHHARWIAAISRPRLAAGIGEDVSLEHSTGWWKASHHSCMGSEPTSRRRTWETSWLGLEACDPSPAQNWNLKLPAPTPSLCSWRACLPSRQRRNGQLALLLVCCIYGKRWMIKQSSV